VSRSTVTKTLKKDLGAIEKRLARFRMDAVLPGMGSRVGQGGRRVGPLRCGCWCVMFPRLHLHHLGCAGVPKTTPLSELQPPVTKVTTLENGLRVATQETYGPVRSKVISCVFA